MSNKSRGRVPPGPPGKRVEYLFRKSRHRFVVPIMLLTAALFFWSGHISPDGRYFFVGGVGFTLLSVAIWWEGARRTAKLKAAASTETR